VHRLAFLLLLALGCATAPAAKAPPGPQPPVARREPTVTTLHGQTRTDDYAWLRRKGAPDVEAYLRAETEYASAVMRETEPLQDRLYREALARLQQTDLEVPYLRRGYWYYSRTEEGKQYPLRCRKRGSLDAPEQILLDLNALAAGRKFLGLGGTEVSDDGRLLAYSTDDTGFRVHVLQVKDLDTGAVLPDRIERVDSFAWAADGRTLFYVTEDDAKRPSRLWRHALGTPASADVLLYEEKDERFNVGVARTRSLAYLVVQVQSKTASEVLVLRADEPLGRFRQVAPRRPETEYDVDHRGDRFWIRTNDRGRNFRLVSAPVSEPGPSSWREEVPHREDVMLEGVEAFAGHLVLVERRDGLPRFTALDPATGQRTVLDFGEPAYSAFPRDNAEFETATFRYSFQSLVTPPSVYDWSVSSGERRLLKREPVPGGYDPARYRQERLQARAPDGTRVPISLVRRSDLPPGPRPLLLAGYGSYGFPYPVTFDRSRVSLLDRGVVFAVAHVRGGGEMGKRWHDDGRMLRKANTFTDFVACTEFLEREGITAPDRLAITGGSAGGLLVGAVLNMRPDLFRAAVALVPFVDVVNTMLDESLPLTVTEFEEWGNPKVREQYEYIRSYSPYDNVGAHAYPALLVKSAYNDSQVMYFEPAKWVARLRATRQGASPILLHMDMDPAGHGGKSGRLERLREQALVNAFVLWQLGIRD
jgi:oligopeptidase B